MHSDKKEVLNKGLASLAIKLAGLALGFVLTFYLAKKYGSLGTGIFATTMTLLQVLSIFTKFGTDAYLLREISKNPQLPREALELYREIFLLVFYFSLIISVVLYILDKQILYSLFHNNLKEDTFVFIISSYILYTLLTMNFTFLKAIRETALQSFFNYLSLFLFMLLILLAFYNRSYEAETIIKALFVAILVSFLTSLMAVLVKSKASFSSFTKTVLAVPFERVTKTLILSAPFLLTSALMLIMNWIDTIMIATLVSSEAVGVYYIVAKFSMIVTLPSVALCNILAPKFSTAFNKKHFSKINELVRWAFGKVAIATIFIFLAFTMLGEWILELYGNDFHKGYSSLLFLTGGQLLNSFVGVIAALLLVAHHEKKFAYIMLLASFINILLNLFLIPSYNILGASIASFFSFVFLFCSSLYIYRKDFYLRHV